MTWVDMDCALVVRIVFASSSLESQLASASVLPLSHTSMTSIVDGAAIPQMLKKAKAQTQTAKIQRTSMKHGLSLIELTNFD